MPFSWLWKLCISKRRRELNKLEREHKENIKSIKSDYFDSLKDIRKEKDNRLKENQKNYIERENKIYYRSNTFQRWFNS